MSESAETELEALFCYCTEGSFSEFEQASPRKRGIFTSINRLIETAISAGSRSAEHAVRRRRLTSALRQSGFPRTSICCSCC
jgi:aconitase A